MKAKNMSDSEAAINSNSLPANGTGNTKSGNGSRTANGQSNQSGETNPENLHRELETRNRALLEANRALQQTVEELQNKNRVLLEQNFALQNRVDSSGAYEKERADFISAVAHELRTPLTSIKGYIDLVLEGEAGDINDLQREFLSVVGANADKLSRIIGDLLDVSRLEAGRMTFKPMMIDLRSLVSQTCESVRPQTEAKDIRFELELPPASGGPGTLEVSADRDRFSQALRSILANAVQITPQGGTVHLSLKPDKNGEKAVISIEDEGPGIEPQDMPKVFTKFWHPDSPGWREGGGPGLRLAISKTIVDMHEGSIEAANRPEGGSVFTIRMPLVNRVAVGDLEQWIEQETTRPEPAVLVVSHDPGFGKLIQHMLGRANFQVIVAGDQDEVVSESPAWQPDLIIENGAERIISDISSTSEAPHALRVAPILTLQLSNAERRLLQADALGILPWPTTEQTLLENLVLAIGSELNQQELADFKRNKPILLVSGSTESLRNLDRILREDGYSRVYRATQESDALTLARRYRPALLLVDVYGNEDDERGPAFFEMLREDPLLRDTPAVVLTPSSNIKEAPAPEYRTGLRSPASGEGKSTNYYNVIPKPFLQRRFINVARRLTGAV
jgi:signal transduction histidine kinase/ActR/RegA family two-component response regulator